MLGEVGVDVLAQRAVRVAEVVARLEARQPAQRPGQPGQLVEVDVPLHAAVAHLVAHRLGAHVPDLDRVPPGSYHDAPRLRAAATPEWAPSSWKPHPW